MFSLGFTSDSKHLISLGNRDKNDVVVWDVASGKAMCGAVNKTDGYASSLLSFNSTPNKFVTAGEGHLKLWTLDTATYRLSSVDVSLGKLKRVCALSISIFIIRSYHRCVSNLMIHTCGAARIVVM